MTSLSIVLPTWFCMALMPLIVTHTVFVLIKIIITIVDFKNRPGLRRSLLG